MRPHALLATIATLLTIAAPAHATTYTTGSGLAWESTPDEIHDTELGYDVVYHPSGNKLMMFEGTTNVFAWATIDPWGTYPGRASLRQLRPAHCGTVRFKRLHYRLSGGCTTSQHRARRVAARIMRSKRARSRQCRMRHRMICKVGRKRFTIRRISTRTLHRERVHRSNAVEACGSVIRAQQSNVIAHQTSCSTALDVGYAMAPAPHGLPGGAAPAGWNCTGPLNGVVTCSSGDASVMVVRPGSEQSALEPHRDNGVGFWTPAA